ncbi:hypothetical protein [Paraburkholderia phenoliruptrix]|uniref:hypothetical protein n=1 Tax=Paraburkholderia phenoliruptrix TaxID=252970 RepID=UPI0034CE8330
MAKVICTLPNASELISGVKFVTHKLGMISEEIEDDVAEIFLSIKGYVLHGKNAAKEVAALQAGANAQAPAATDAPQDPAYTPEAPGADQTKGQTEPQA